MIYFCAKSADDTRQGRSGSPSKIISVKNVGMIKDGNSLTHSVDSV
jgi:hypothetical protein